MKRSKISIVSFILTFLIIVSSVPVSAAPDKETCLNDTSLSSVSQKKDLFFDDKIPGEIAEEPADTLSCRITDYIDKAQFEAQNYAFRVEQDESLNTYVFQKEDGKRVVYFLDENVKFIDDNGEIKEKDLSLKSTEKGFSPTCNDIDIFLPATMEETIRFNYGKSSITVAPSGGILVKGESDGRSVSYSGVFGENTILRYTPLLSGLKEDIIVTDRTAPTEYSFILKTDGLLVYSDKDGSYLAANEQSEEKIRLGKVVAYDAKGHESIGDLLVNTVSEGSEYVVTVSIDQKFLVNESTVFPVTIDPTFTVSDNTHGANAIQDAPIFQNKPSINFGTYLYDRVGTPDNNYGVGRTVVRLSGFTSAAEYTTITASQIDSVLFCARESSGGNTQTINLHPITGVSTWIESTVTWNTIGSNFNASVNFGTTMYNGQWSSFDITNLVKGWKNGTYTADCGFILKNSNESNNKCFDSCECSTTGNRPYVVMTYDPYSGGDSFDDAEIINLNTYYTVNIDTPNKLKYFKFIPSSTGFYTFESTDRITGDPYGRLFNNNQDILANNDDSGSGTNFRITYHLMSSYTYYFSAGCFGTGTGSYSVRIYKTTSASYIESPTVIAWGNTKSISTSYSQASKYYKFTPSVSGEYLFYSSDNTGDPRIWIYNSSMALVGSNDDNAGNKNFRLVISLTSGNTYYLAAGHFSNYTGTYKMSSMMVGNITTGVNHIRNIGSQMYIDIQGPSAQEYVEQWSVYTAESEKWTIKKQSDGYYTLQSEYGSKKFMGVENSNIGEDNVKLYSSIGDNTKWKIFVHPDGDLIIEPKNYNGKVLYVPSNSISANLQLEWMSAVVSSRNKWKIEYSSTTPLEGQRWTNWCWATSARMLVKHYYSSMPNTRDQPNAVREVHGSIIDHGGTHENAISAAGYYRSADIGINVLNLTGAFGSRFSESTLRQFLDDNHVVYIARGHYSLSNVRNGGHATLIVGYTTVFVNGSMQYRFKINDPWPLSEPTEWPDDYVDSTTGQILIRSYQWICNGRTGTASTDIIDDGIWDRYVVVTTSYSSSVLTPVWN